jgi:ribosome-binding ATPase YchF (GTP1/OBG family)
LDRGLLTGYGFLTDRPLLVALNRSEERAAEPLPADIATRLRALDAAGLTLSASVEAEIATLAPDEQAAFLADLGLAESALARFIRAAYGLLDLISFFTVGVDEVRAWPIRRGTHAREAAGRIHSDLERGFIRAEVIPVRRLHEVRVGACGEGGRPPSDRRKGLRRVGRRYHAHQVQRVAW